MADSKTDLDWLREKVNCLKNLLDNPHPGLMSWSMAFGGLMDELTACWLDETGADGHEQVSSLGEDEKAVAVREYVTGKDSPFPKELHKSAMVLMTFLVENTKGKTFEWSTYGLANRTGLDAQEVNTLMGYLQHLNVAERLGNVEDN